MTSQELDAFGLFSVWSCWEWFTSGNCQTLSITPLWTPLILVDDIQTVIVVNVPLWGVNKTVGQLAHCFWKINIWQLNFNKHLANISTKVCQLFLLYKRFSKHLLWIHLPNICHLEVLGFQRKGSLFYSWSAKCICCEIFYK